MSTETFEYKSTSISGSQQVKGAVNLDEAQGIVECFVAGIGNKDSVGDVCAPGAFTKSLLRRKPRVVWGHNWNDPIGKVLEIYEVGSTDPRLPLKMKMAGIGGLFAKVQFNLNSEKGKEAFANVAFFGEEQEWSIGYKTLRAQFDQKSQANILYEVELYEVSPVLHGANQLTGTISVKADDSAYGGAVALMPESEDDNGFEEMEKELSRLLNAKVSINAIEGDSVIFTRQEAVGAKKYRCGFMKNHGRYMFGIPEMISTPQSMRPMSPMPVVSGRPMPPNEPQRIVRPQQMPSIPVAVKPSSDGVMMIPLPAIRYDSSSKPQIDKNNLDQEESDLRDALLKIVKRHGKLDEDGDGIWAGYYPPEKNPVASIGVKCANCVFYKGGSSCEILALPVHPEGKCRFAVIPNGVVVGSSSKELEDLASEAEDSIIETLEMKYPGEFILGVLRNTVGRRKKRRQKYKNLSEFGDADDTGEKAYLIPVEPDFAFSVKTALDPIFDYHRAETFVDKEGIVISSGVTEELIDALDTAFHNIKKKFQEHNVEVKALGYRIGRSLASRAIDRPNIGGKKRGRGFGMPEGDLNPMTRVDKNRDGTLFDNIPGWEQPDPTPDGPGSINNAKLSSTQKRDIDKISGEANKIKPQDSEIIKSRKPKYDVNELDDILGEDKKKPSKKPVAKATPIKKEKAKRGKYDFSKGPKKDKPIKTPSLASGEEKDKKPKTPSRKKPKMTDEEIYKKRITTKASLQELADELGISRMEVRKREQRHMRKLRNDKQSPSLSSGEKNEWATARGYEPDRFDLREAVEQIGRGNIMAISGGRVERRGNEMILPSTKDQQVVIGYNAVPDLYYVRAEQKVNTGKNKGKNKILAQWDDVYADELGELAYQASLKPALLNSENKEYWKLGKGNQFTDKLIDRRSGKLVDDEVSEKPSSTPSKEETPSLSSGGRGRDYYKYDIDTSDNGNGLLDQIHDALEENPLLKDDITADIADMLGGDGIVEANGFDTRKAFNLVTGSDDDFQGYLDVVDDAMDALKNGSLAKHKATVRDANTTLDSLKSGSDEAGKLEALRDRSYEWIGDINKYSRISTIKDKKNIEANDVAARMVSKEQDALWNARSAITEKYIEDVISAKKESKRRVPIDDVDTEKIPDYELALSSGSVFKNKPVSKTLDSKSDGLSLSSGENKKIYDEIGKSILEALIEMQKNPQSRYWDVPWRTPTLYAKNPTKGRLYQGMNALLLANSHRQNQYRGNFWAGKSQWAKFGGTVEDGKSGVNILVPRETPTGKTFIVQTVYNLDDIEGLPDSYVKKLLDVGKERLDPATKIKDAESVVDEIKPEIRFGGDSAYYSITNDHIQMPPYEMFKSPEQYYSTLLHELTHWTGGKSRLARKQVGLQKDEEAYSFEELIAEMGSSFLLAALGITPEVRQDHVVYIESWISNLTKDPSAFIRAMNQAQQAADWVMDRSPTLRRLAGVPDSERKGKPDATKEVAEAATESVDAVKDSTPSLSSGAQVGVRKVKELQYFGDEDQYGSGVVDRDSRGRILDAAGALSLSSGAKPIKSVDGKITVPRPSDNVPYREKYKFLANEFEPTEQQKASMDVLQHMLKEKINGIIAIGAGAGSGKTTNLKQNARAVAAIFPGKQIYYTVFNRGNAKDGNRVMPRNTGVATSNQIAYWSLVLGTGDKFYGTGTAKKIQLGVGPREKVYLRGAKKNTVKEYTDFEGNKLQFTGVIPGYTDLGYTSYDSEPNIIERLEKLGLLSDADELLGADYSLAEMLKKALMRFAESEDPKLSAKHFLLRDVEMISALLDGKPVPTEETIPKEVVEIAQKLWDETVDPNSNVLIPQEYQIKMWALTKPDLRTDKGLIGHRPNETIFDRIKLGTVEDLDSGKIKIGNIIEFTVPETGEKVAAVIRKLNPPSQKETKKGELTGKRQVTGSVSIVSVTANNPLEVFMFDEAQDVNPVMAKVLADNAANLPIIMVGDSRQAIYGFRGAMDALDKANATFRLPLTRSFRYGRLPAYLANVVLMQGNIDDLNFHRENETLDRHTFHHVVGEAQNVVINALKITGPDGKKLLPKEELDKKLKFIEVKYKLKGRAVSFDGKSEKEIKELVDKLYEEHVPKANGQIVENMTNPQAVLTSTNAGVMEEALNVVEGGILKHQIAYLDLLGIEDITDEIELANRLKKISEIYTLDGLEINLLDIAANDGKDAMLKTINELREEHAPGGADGKIPAIGIPADTHEKLYDFYNQLDWIMGDLDNKFGVQGRPKASKLLKDVWRFDKKKNRYPTKEEMVRKIERMVQGGSQELKTWYRLAYPPIGKGIPRGARFFKDLLRPNGQVYKDLNGNEQRYQGLRPMREGIELPNMESGKDHITADLIKETAKEPLGESKSGRRRKISWIIPKKDEGDSSGEVFVKLELDENGKSTGGVIIAGNGAHGGKYKFRKWNNKKKEWDPIQSGQPDKKGFDYYEDLAKVAKKLKAEYPDAVIEFKQGLVKQDGKALTFPPDTPDDFKPKLNPKTGNPDSSVERASLPGWVVRGRNPEETALIANEFGNRVRKLAAEGNTDVDVMTVHIAKGREWKRVRLSDDFRDPESLVPTLPPEVLENLKPKERLRVLRELEMMKREEHNKVYIAITRAQEQIDLGVAITKYYFLDEIPNTALTADIQEIRKRIEDLDKEISKLQKKPNSDTDPAIKKEINRLKKEKIEQNKILNTSRDMLQAQKVTAAKAKIVENPDGIYDDLQAPEGFITPYLADTEEARAKRKKRQEELDQSVKRYFESQRQKEKQQATPDDDDEAMVEDDSGGLDTGEPNFVDISGPEDDSGISSDDQDDDGDVQSLSLSSGAKKKTNRRNRRLPYSQQDRQNLADGNIIRSKKIPKKRKPGPSTQEFDDLALASGAKTPEGRYARRLRAISLSSGSDDIGAGAKTRQINGKRFAATISRPRDLAAIRVDGDPNKNDEVKNKLEYAMKFWRGVRERGIALDPDDVSAERKDVEIKNSISSISKRMSTRPKVKIGKVSSNQIKDDVNPDEWFVPVSKLKDSIRIPTEFSNIPADPDSPDGRKIARWTQTRPLSNDELGKMLALSKTDIKKLSDDDSGITHDSVRFLLAEIGKQKGFEAWRLFAPTSLKEEGVQEMSPADKFVANLERANMRDRFIIEAFGKDAFPYWIDKEENTVIGQKEYSTLGEVSEMGKFRSTGIFSKKRGASEFGSTAEEMLLEEAVFGGDDGPGDFVKEAIINSASAPSGKTSREQFDISQLLQALKINESEDWYKELRKRMMKAFSTDDVGLTSKEVARQWEAGGVPTTYINEMIRTGLIPDAKSVWKKDGVGEKLDSELAASKHSVYEALFEFTQAKHAADKAKNTRRNRDYILGSTDFTVSHKGVAARKGATFSKKTGDERRFSQSELQDVVNRFNEIFGTNYKIDDIFSAEQLRNATKRLREEGKTLYGEEPLELGQRVVLKKDKNNK